MFNTTNIAGSSSASASTSGASYSRTATNYHLEPEQAGNLGYGLGRLARGGVDYLTNWWQSYRNAPSQEQLAMDKQVKIFHIRIEKFVSEFHSALNKIDKDPKNGKAHKEIESIASILMTVSPPNDSQDLQDFQNSKFDGLKQRISKMQLPTEVVNKLKSTSPDWFQNMKSTENDSEKGQEKKLDSHRVKKQGRLQEAEVKTSSRSIWSNFFSIPVAEGQVLDAHHFNARNFPPIFDLSTLNGANGFVLNGENAFDESGWSVSGAGDINGDDIADLVVGALRAGSNAGKTYVIFGSKAGWSSPISLSSLNGANGFVLNGINTGDQIGFSVSGAGDINGDSVADLVVGGLNPFSKPGKTYVIFGRKAGWGSPISLSSLNGTNGFILNDTNTGNDSGNSVSGAGDINGDGIADLVLGAPGAIGSGAGTTYVIFGSKAGWSSPISLSSLNGANGFVLNGINAGDQTGNSLSGAKDINGDGITDLVVGAYNAGVSAGKTYVIFGSKAGWSVSINLSNLNGTNGFVLNGENPGDQSGFSVSGAGDINGDGIADLIVGAPSVGSKAGKIYVIFGSKAGWSSLISLSSLNGANGFVLNGENAGDQSGSSVSGAGDINGDGIADLVVGAPVAGTRAGKTYVIFGQANGMTTTTPGATTTRPITTSPTPSSSNIGAIVGGVVGGVAVVATAITIAIIWAKKKGGLAQKEEDVPDRLKSNQYFNNLSL